MGALGKTLVDHSCERGILHGSGDSLLVCKLLVYVALGVVAAFSDQNVDLQEKRLKNRTNSAHMLSRLDRSERSTTFTYSC